jgi:Ser/Thr protein kinase RdoA (MazF antagonist)
MKEYFNRINLNTDLSNISIEICKKYNLGDYVSDKIITQGYEDFNYVLNTLNGKWFVKILCKNRNEQEVKGYLDRLTKVCELSLSFPKVLSYNDSLLYEFKVKDVIYRIIVFEHINGKNIFELGVTLNEKEINYIAQQIKIIHSIDIKPNFIYDSWAINSFPNEYAKKQNIIPIEFKDRIDKLYNAYKNIDFNELPHTFVHGDIMNTNIMKDENNKLWLIDFAVSNYLPRIQDLVVVACNICVTDNKEESYKRIKILINEYAKEYNFTKYEKEIFRILFDISNAMFLMQASYQKSIGNNSEETKFWFNKGARGLIFSDEKSFNEIM